MTEMDVHRRFETRPLLVFWETTKACPLSCHHCRASARQSRDENELPTEEGFRLIDELASPGKPRTILILTGGDCLVRPDLFDLLDHARGRGVSVAVAPSVSPSLTGAAADRLYDAGVRSVSISLDGATPWTHESIRGISGHYEATVNAIDMLVRRGFHVQVNTTVMPSNVMELPDIAALLHWHAVPTWEVFFLITTGRGASLAELNPNENEAVCHFLVDAARYGITVRTVEAPFFRRVRQWRSRHDSDTAEVFGLSSLYQRLRTRLTDQLGEPTQPVDAPTVATRDGNGVVFVAHDGSVYPSGFLPINVGNVRESPLLEIYRESALLRALRDAEFSGACGRCDFRFLCGGSRARAYCDGDPFGSDPGCAMASVAQSTAKHGSPRHGIWNSGGGSVRCRPLPRRGHGPPTHARARQRPAATDRHDQRVASRGDHQSASA